MIKVAIVSRVHGINYGANLQAVALQSVLRVFGVDSCYLDYEVKYRNHGVRGILSWGYSLLRLLFGYNQRLTKTKEFRNNYLVFSKHLCKYDDLYQLTNAYDVFLSGSDQVWNPRYLAVSRGLYLLEFTDKIKVSYASSFGVNHLSDSVFNRYKESLSKYKSLSVREKTGADIIHKMGLDCQVVLDPTLLLELNQWKNYFAPNPIINKKYICCYVMPGDEDCIKAVIRLAKNLNSNKYQIIVLGDKEYKKLMGNSTIRYVTTAGPAEFLNIMFYSELVITSSFHGTCFSLLFSKLFYTVINENSDVNSRIFDLLTTLGMESRMVNTKAINDVKIVHNIDYSRVSKLLEEKRSKSLDYLKSVLTIQ